MTKIDISKWEEVRLGDYFEFAGVKQAKTQQAVPSDEEGIPYVVQSIRNNMVSRYVNRQWLIDNNEPPQKGNTIVLGVTLPAVSYQRDEFGASQVITARNSKMNEKTGIFIATVLSKYIHRFAYDQKPGIEIYQSMKVKLPIKLGGDLDWGYMESYIENIMREENSNLENLKKIDNKKTLIDKSQWKKFKLGGDDGLFEIVKGSRLTRADMRLGKINFVSASSFNNGVAAHISNSEKIHPANTMTVSYNGSDIGRTFYQEVPFWASDDVNVLYPRFELNKEIALFLAPLIKNAGGSHVYKNKWLQTDMMESSIPLPVKSDGTPDWEYMKNYMQAVMNTAEKQLEILDN